MKQIINEIFRLPMKPKLKNHILTQLGFVGDDLEIIKSLFDYDGTSQFHYDKTHLSKRTYEDHLTDGKLVEIVKDYTTQINTIKERLCENEKQQAMYNGANTAAMNCMSGQIAQLFALTKLVVPNSSVCPGWGNVNITPATTPAAA